MRKLLIQLLKYLPAQPVFAHCDIPCGIYDPKFAQIAAETVLKMVKMIGDLPTENPSVEDRNNFVRMVWTKEEHAQRCKEELLILWTDYFKPAHLKQFPNLHEIFWKATKLCSQNKQHVSLELAKQLVTSVNNIADIFIQTKTS